MTRRLTVAEAKLTGADRHNPKRHAGRADPPVKPLGDPPAKLSESEREAWLEFAENMPWLAASDRQLVALTSLLCGLAQARDCPLGVYAQLRLCLSSMGGTPVDRSRVQWKDDDGADPANEFFN